MTQEQNSNKGGKDTIKLLKFIMTIVRSFSLVGIIPLLLFMLLLPMIGLLGQDEESGSGIGMSAIGEKEIPADYIPIYQEAGEKYGIPWTLLASFHKVETNFGTVAGGMVSSAGALGHFQFMPQTWVGWSYPGIPTEPDLSNVSIIESHGGYGVDADGDGRADPFNIKDSCFSAAKYLKANGAPGDMYGAIFSYNHADWYVERVLKYYQMYTDGDYTEAGNGIQFEGDNETVEKAIQVGQTLIGKSPYTWGGGRNQADIDARLFDCSSFVHWMYSQAGVNLGNFSNVTTWTLLELGKSVPASEMQPGDLLFFDTEGANTHVGVYIGNGKMINDQNTYGVSEASVTTGYWSQTFNGNVRRVVAN